MPFPENAHTAPCVFRECVCPVVRARDVCTTDGRTTTQVLHFLVLDGDTLSSDDVIGETLLPLDSLVDYPLRFADLDRPLLLTPPTDVARPAGVAVSSADQLLTDL